MITVEVRASASAEDTFESLFEFRNLNVPVTDLAQYLASTILNRVRTRFLKQENPDGSKWPMTGAAAIRLAGGYTSAKGGKYAPGGRKTGGNILFSSGNLFHSIMMKSRGRGTYAVQSDVPYAAKWMNDEYQIIGTSNNEIDTLLKGALQRML